MRLGIAARYLNSYLCIRAKQSAAAAICLRADILEHSRTNPCSGHGGPFDCWFGTSSHLYFLEGEVCLSTVFIHFWDT